MASDRTPSLLSIGEGRFKRSLLGYRPREVDAAIANRDAAIAFAGERLARRSAWSVSRAELEAQRRGARGANRRRIEELERVATRLASGWWSASRSCETGRAEIVALREAATRGCGRMAALADDLETVRRQARRQATRIRMRALREAAELTARIGSLAEGPDEASERLTESLAEAIARMGTVDDRGRGPTWRSPAANGHPESGAGEALRGPGRGRGGAAERLLAAGRVRGRRRGIGATSEISVKRFTQGRATLAMRFKQPVELLSELEERAPFEFRVRDTRSDRLVLDVDG